LALTFLCFVFCCFPSTTCSFFHTLPCYYLLHLSHSALLLFVASFMFHPNTIRCFLHTSPCYYLLPHASLVVTCSFALHLLLPIPSFALCLIIIYSFLCASRYSYSFSPSHFTLPPTYSLLHASPYYYMLLPLCFTLLLPTPSFVFYPMTTCFFLCVSLCYLPTSFAFHHVASITNANIMKFNHLNVHP
jgi:hypothetical protein